MKLATPACVQTRPRRDPAVSGAGPGRRAPSATRLFILDSDGPVRRIAPVVQVGERTIPSLSLAAITAAGATATPAVSVDQGQCAALVPWRGPAENANGQPTFTSYSFYDLFHAQQQILEGQKPDIDPALFKDRIVIVGVNADGLHEVFTTPFPEGEINGPEVHANVTDAHAGEPFDRRDRPRGSRWRSRSPAPASSAWPACSSTRGSPAPWRSPPRRSWSGSRWSGSRAASGSPSPFPRWRSSLPSSATSRGSTLSKDARSARSRSSSPATSRRTSSISSWPIPSLAALGGARRHMTVLFSDIRGFTTMSEKGTPEEVVSQLNELFHAHGRRGVRASRHGRQVRRRHGDGPLRRAPGRRRARRSRGADGAGDDPHAERDEPANGRARGSRRSTSASASTPAIWWPATLGPIRS